MKMGSTLGEAGQGGKTAGFGARSCRQNWQGMILNHPCPIPSLRCSRAAGSPRKNAAGPRAGLRFVARHQQGLPTSLGPPDATRWPCPGDKDLCSCMGKPKGHFFWRRGCHYLGWVGNNRAHTPRTAYGWWLVILVGFFFVPHNPLSSWHQPALTDPSFSVIRWFLRLAGKERGPSWEDVVGKKTLQSCSNCHSPSCLWTF